MKRGGKARSPGARKRHLQPSINRLWEKKKREQEQQQEHQQDHQQQQQQKGKKKRNFLQAQFEDAYEPPPWGALLNKAAVHEFARRRRLADYARIIGQKKNTFEAAQLLALVEANPPRRPQLFNAAYSPLQPFLNPKPGLGMRSKPRLSPSMVPDDERDIRNFNVLSSAVGTLFDSSNQNLLEHQQWMLRLLELIECGSRSDLESRCANDILNQVLRVIAHGGRWIRAVFNDGDERQGKEDGHVDFEGIENDEDEEDNENTKEGLRGTKAEHEPLLRPISDYLSMHSGGVEAKDEATTRVKRCFDFAMELPAVLRLLEEAELRSVIGLIPCAILTQSKVTSGEALVQSVELWLELQWKHATQSATEGIRIESNDDLKSRIDLMLEAVDKIILAINRVTSSSGKSACSSEHSGIWRITDGVADAVFAVHAIFFGGGAADGSGGVFMNPDEAAEILSSPFPLQSIERQSKMTTRCVGRFSAPGEQTAAYLSALTQWERLEESAAAGDYNGAMNLLNTSSMALSSRHQGIDESNTASSNSVTAMEAVTMRFHVRVVERGIGLLERGHEYDKAVWFLRLSLAVDVLEATGMLEHSASKRQKVESKKGNGSSISKTNYNVHRHGVVSSEVEVSDTIIAPLQGTSLQSTLWLRLIMDQQHIGNHRRSLDLCEALLEEDQLPRSLEVTEQSLLKECKSNSNNNIRDYLLDEETQKFGGIFLSQVDRFAVERQAKKLWKKHRVRSFPSAFAMNQTSAISEVHISLTPEQGNHKNSSYWEERTRVFLLRCFNTQETRLFDRHTSSANEMEQIWQGEHCENAILLTLFALLFWDILSDKSWVLDKNNGNVRKFSEAITISSSQSKCMDGKVKNRLPLTLPLDLVLSGQFFKRGLISRIHDEGLSTVSYGFAHRQMDSLRERLRCIAEGGQQGAGKSFLSDLLRCAWTNYYGIPNLIGVDWNRWSIDELETIAHGIGGPALASICAALAQDYSTASHGLPDLLFWKKSGASKKSQTVRFVEVKGPGDSVSPNQHLWLGRLHNAGVPVAVAYVSEGRTPPDTATGIVLPFTH